MLTALKINDTSVITNATVQVFAVQIIADQITGRVINNCYNTWHCIALSRRAVARKNFLHFIAYPNVVPNVVLEIDAAKTANGDTSTTKQLSIVVNLQQ